MGRPSKGLRVEWRNGIGYARFTHAGREHLLSTGKRDSGAAEEEARRLYARVTGGNAARPESTKHLVRADLPTLFAEWLASLEGSLDVETLKTYETTYCGKHWPTHYDTLRGMCEPASRERYRSARLRAATASTVKKETWAQDKFLRWCKTMGLIAPHEIPPRLEWDKKMLGTRTGTQRKKARELTIDQTRRFIDELPEWFEVGHRAMEKKPYPIQDRFEVAYETGLRPATLHELVWADWRGDSLVIRDEVDKIRYGREVPLTERARLAFARVHDGSVSRGIPVAPTDPIFGKHLYRKTIAAAAKRAGLDGVAPYDLRHGRATHMADAGAAITGIGYLVGHKQATTTNRYLHQSERAARQALAVSTVSFPGSLSVPTENGTEKEGWPRRFELPTPGATILVDAADQPEKRLDGENESSNDAAGTCRKSPTPNLPPETICELRRALAALHGDADGRVLAMAEVQP